MGGSHQAFLQQVLCAQIFRAAAMSQFFYNCHVWTVVSDKDWERWRNSLLKPMRLKIRGKLRGVNPLHIDMDEACS